MKSDRIIGMLIRAAMDTAMRHIPRWLGQRAGTQGSARAHRVERDTAQKMKMMRKLMRWIR